MWWVLFTARSCALAHAAALLLSVVTHGVVSHKSQPDSRVAVTFRVVWTLAFGLLLIHTLVAFHFLHEWSHFRAWEHTATRTEELTGWRWGGGIWANYVALALWGADIGLVWTFGFGGGGRAAFLAPWAGGELLNQVTCPPRGRMFHLPALLHQLIWLYLLFLQFQATIVFGSAAVRWPGVAVVAVWGILRWRQSRPR